MRKTWSHLMVSDTFYFIVDDTVFCPNDDNPYCPLTPFTTQTRRVWFDSGYYNMIIYTILY
jgi:hypothetical protein